MYITNIPANPPYGVSKIDTKSSGWKVDSGISCVIINTREIPHM